MARCTELFQSSTDDRGLSDVPAVLLVGGQGTRLRSVVHDRPKPLAPVGGRPFVCYLLEQLADAGVRKALLCCGYCGEQVPSTLGTQFGPLALEYQQEAGPRGTAGAIMQALPRMAGRTLLVANGDSYCAADLSQFLQYHKERRAGVTMLLTEVDHTGRYGRVECDRQGRIVRFVEKGDCHGPGTINAGVYLFERELLQSLVAAQPKSLERDVFPRLIGRGLFGYAGGRAFLDIGTPESYARAEAFFQSVGPDDARSRAPGAARWHDGCIVQSPDWHEQRPACPYGGLGQVVRRGTQA